MTHTNTQQKAPRTCDSTNINSADSLSYGTFRQAHDGKTSINRPISVYARIQHAMSGFYILRGVGIEAFGTLIFVAAFAAVQGMQ